MAEPVVPYHGDPDELASELNRIHDVVRRMWRDAGKYGASDDQVYRAGFRAATRDLACELGVDLDD